MNDRLSGVISTRLTSRARSRDEVNTPRANARAGGRLNPSVHQADELRSLKQVKLEPKKDQISSYSRTPTGRSPEFLCAIAAPSGLYFF